MDSIRQDALGHPASLAGAALATIAGVLLAAFMIAGILGFEGSPYTGVVVYVVLPAILLAGLVLIPVGGALGRRRRARARASGAAQAALPVLDLNHPRTRRLALLFLALTTVNVVLLAGASYRAVEVMDSPEFCGSCHSVMDPEASAYRRSPHAHVRCVECHIGPGAGWFVKSKLSGTWQLVSVALKLYPRPIPTPVRNLRPARETCERCHWPARFVGDRLVVRTSFADDAESTPLTTVNLLHVGGVEATRSRGIHWHVDPGVRVRFFSDVKREQVGPIDLVAADGTRRRYDVKGEPIPGGQWREMDCVDCHNRPTHVFPTPEREVDDAIAAGQIDRRLPFVRREAVKALRVDYPSAGAARAGIRAQLQAFYLQLDPARAADRRDAVERAAARVGDIWAADVWPGMRIGWGTYPSFLGHEQAPGCFRCHDGEHATADGRTISNDCDLCHQLLAQEEKAPAILKQLSP